MFFSFKLLRFCNKKLQEKETRAKSPDGIYKRKSCWCEGELSSSGPDGGEATSAFATTRHHRRHHAFGNFLTI